LVGFGFDLGVGVIWHWVCDLQNCWKVCYLGHWQMVCYLGSWWRLWRKDTTGNRSELGLDCFGRFAVEKAKGRMESIVDGGGGEPITWCG
jgi:hypothetical protein